MKTESSGRGVRVGMRLSAAVLAVMGLSFLFAPGELCGVLGQDRGGGPIVEVLGSVLLGFAMADWVARDSILGGIYGRALVVGNQVHFSVGALLLLKHGVASGSPAAYWAFVSVYLVEALWFSWLMWGAGESKSQR